MELTGADDLGCPWDAHVVSLVVGAAFCVGGCCNAMRQHEETARGGGTRRRHEETA